MNRCRPGWRSVADRVSPQPLSTERPRRRGPPLLFTMLRVDVPVPVPLTWLQKLFARRAAVVARIVL